MNTLGTAISNGITHTLDVRGRLDRTSFWLFFLFLALVGFLVNTVLFLTTAAPASTILFGGLSPLAIIISIVLAIPLVTAMIRRLHDAGYGGWHVLWYVVPNLFAYVLLYAQAQIPVTNINGTMLLALLSVLMLLLYLAGYIVLLILLTRPSAARSGQAVVAR